MVDDGVQADIAFIRNALEEGRAFARTRSPDMAVWGLFVAAGYLGTYAFARRWWSIDPNWIWLVCIVLPWAYSLRRFWLRLFGRDIAVPVRSPTARAFAMLWLGSGLSILTLAIAANWSGMQTAYHWYDAAVACVLATAFFAGSFLCNVGWLRFVAVAWWAGALLMFGAHGEAVLLFGAAWMLAFLAAPGLVLFLSAQNAQ